MMKLLTRSLLTTVSCFALAGFSFGTQANAAIPSFNSSAPWQTSTTTSSGTENCAVTGTFDNGFIMDMGGKHGALDVISVNFRQDIFNAGETYQANLHVPGQVTTAARATAIDTSTLGIPVSNKDALFTAIKNARALNLGVEGNEFAFNLRDFGSSVSFLESCQARANPPEPAAVAEKTPAPITPREDTMLDSVSSNPAVNTASARPAARERYIDRLDTSMRGKANAAPPAELVAPPADVVETFKNTNAMPDISTADTFENRPQSKRPKFIPMKAPEPEAVVPVVSAPVLETPVIAQPQISTPVIEAPEVAAPIIEAPAIQAPTPKITTAQVLSDDPQPRPTARPTSLIRRIAPPPVVPMAVPVTTPAPSTYTDPIVPQPQINHVYVPPAAPVISAPTQIIPETITHEAPRAEPQVAPQVVAPAATLNTSSFDTRPQKAQRRDMSATWTAPEPVYQAPEITATPAQAMPEKIEFDAPHVIAPANVAPQIDSVFEAAPATPVMVDVDMTPASANTFSVASIGDVLGDDLQPRPTARPRSIVRKAMPEPAAPVIDTPKKSVVMVEKPKLSMPEPYLPESNIMQTKRSANIEADFTEFAEPPVNVRAPRADDLELRQRMAELESKVESLKSENLQLETELDFAIDASRSEKADISSRNWDLEKASMMHNEAERQVKRLGLQLQKERARHEQEKAELETMLFDPAVTSQEQMAKLSSLELELTEKETTLLEQRRLYEERIRILEGQLNGN